MKYFFVSWLKRHDIQGGFVNAACLIGCDSLHVCMFESYHMERLLKRPHRERGCEKASQAEGFGKSLTGRGGGKSLTGREVLGCVDHPQYPPSQILRN